MAVVADNARASELLNHLGSRAKKFCRKCMVSNFVLSVYHAIIARFCQLQATSEDTAIGGMCRTKELAVEQMSEIEKLTTIRENEESPKNCIWTQRKNESIVRPQS